MSIQLYFARLKCLFRNKEAMFWCYLFPILLASCFFFAFNNLWKIEEFETIPIAFDGGGIEASEFKQVLEEAATSNEVKMFDITYCDTGEAEGLLENGDIVAYIVGSSNPKLYVKGNGLDETIIKSFLDTYRQMSVTVSTIMQQNPKAIKEGLLDDVMKYDSYLQEVKNDKKPAEILVYFYALLAYTCLFASSWGLDEVVNIQANLSGLGARVSVSPIHKMKLFICNMLAAFTAHLGSLILLFIYMYYVMKIDFGDNLFLLIVACIAGAFAGLALGAFIGVWVKKKTEIKEAILSAVTLGGAFLSGMMIPAMKYIVQENFPLLAYINPVNLLTDAMYSLYYYDTYERYLTNVLLLVAFTVVLGALAIVGIRRKNYASI